MTPSFSAQRWFLWVCFLCALLCSGRAQATTSNMLKTLQSWNIELRSRPHVWNRHEVEAVMALMKRLPRVFRRLGAIQVRLKRATSRCGAHRPWMDRNKRRRRFGRTSILLDPMAYFRCSIRVTKYKNLPPQYHSTYLLGLQQNLLRELIQMLDEKNRYASSKAWKKLSGWGIDLDGISLGRADNANPKGYAIKKGMKSQSEDFATFATAYFFPVKHTKPGSSIKCRTSYKFAFFAKLFPKQAMNFRHIQCPSYKRWVDPTQVHSLELLYVSPSAKHFSSISGHMLLRIKMKTHLSHLENPNDLVIGFVADVKKTKGLKLAIGGLTGKFLSVFEIRRLGEVVTLYTHKENRDVWRYRLNLNRIELRAVLKWLYRIKQNYRFHYYFLTRNCASVMVEQLRIALSMLPKKDSNKRDFGSIRAGFLVSPNFLISKLATQAYIKEVSPSFYSISKRARIASHHAKIAYTRMKAITKRRKLREVPDWQSLNHKNESVRQKAYKQLREVLKQEEYHPIHTDIYRFSAFQSDVELERYYKTKATESPALQEMRELVFESRHPTFQRRCAQHKPITLPFLHKKEELKHRKQGSTYLGLAPTTVSTRVSLLGWSDTAVGLQVNTALYEQELGDPSRFRLTAGTAIKLLSSSLTFDVNKQEISNWTNDIFQLNLFKSKRSITGERVQSIFQGIEGGGFEVSLFHLAGNNLQDEVTQAKWLGAKVLANIVSSDGHRSYLYVGAGLDATTTWNATNASRSHTAFGTPVTLVGRVVFDENYNTILKGSFTYTPILTTFGTFEQRIQGELLFTQLLGSVNNTEFRLQALAQYSMHIDEARRTLTAGNQELFQATLGLHVRR